MERRGRQLGSGTVLDAVVGRVRPARCFRPGILGGALVSWTLICGLIVLTAMAGFHADDQGLHAPVLETLMHIAACPASQQACNLQVAGCSLPGRQLLV